MALLSLAEYDYNFSIKRTFGPFTNRSITALSQKFSYSIPHRGVHIVPELWTSNNYFQLLPSRRIPVVISDELPCMPVDADHTHEN
jgi:hypothetical protein